MALLAPAALHGQPAAAPFPLSIQYTAGPSCPSLPEVEHELRSRDLLFRSPSPAETATSLLLDAQPDGPSFRGSLVLHLPSGEVTRRSLSGASCADVVRSLLLVAALALAPSPPATPTASSSPPPSSSPPAPAPPPAPTASAPPPTARQAPRGRVGAFAGATSAVGPALTWGGGVWAERGSGPVSGRLTLGFWPHGSVGVQQHAASFSAYLGGLEACRAWSLAERLRLSPCVGLLGGLLQARGQQIENPQTRTRPWLAPTAGARLALGPWWRLTPEATLAGFVPLVRDRFLFETPQVFVYQPPSAGVQLSLGLGMSY